MGQHIRATSEIQKAATVRQATLTKAWCEYLRANEAHRQHVYGCDRCYVLEQCDRGAALDAVVMVKLDIWLKL